jgi:oligopeptide transport system substrate-binding protein
LSFHWERSGKTEKAVDYLLRAGDQARLQYSLEESIDYYQRALNILKDMGDNHRSARTLMKLGITYHNAFMYPESRQTYNQAFDLWRQAIADQPIIQPPTAPHELRLVNVTHVKLDPALASQYHSIELVRQLFSGLVRQTSDFDVLPDGARSWEVQDRGKRYIFSLRKDMYWSDGTPVTAGDFVYAWQRVLDPQTRSPNAEYMYDIKGARAYHSGESTDPNSLSMLAPDSFTIIVELEEPCGHFLQLLTVIAYYPVPRHIVEAHPEDWTDPDHMVTNGPFRLESWIHSKSLKFVRNPRFSEIFNGNIHKVEVALFTSVFDDIAHKLEMYEADCLDVLDITYIAPEHYRRVSRRYSDDLLIYPNLETAYMCFDIHQHPFNDVRIRKAFVLALNSEKIVNEIYLGRFFPPSGGYIPPGMPGHSPGIGLPYDPERARQLLAEAGYPAGKGLPVIRSISLPSMVPYVQQLQVYWRENLGVDLKNEVYDLGSYEKKLRLERPHITGLALSADYPDPDNFFRDEFPWKFSGWQNETYDDLLSEARYTLDQMERMRLCRQADRIILQELPIMICFYGRAEVLVKPWIKGYPLTYFGDTWKNIIIEPH